MTRKGRGHVTLLRLCALLMLAAAVGRLAVITFLPRAVPAAANWGAIDPDFVFRETERRLVERRGALDDADYARVEAAARLDPIADEPFFFFGLRAVLAGKLADAELLLIEARNRNPRNKLARLALLSLYLRTNRVTQAAPELAAFSRLESRAGRFLVPELLPLARTPESRATLVAAIGDQPLMAELLEQLVRDGADPPTILSLAGRQPAPSDGNLARWQSDLIDRLVEQGEIRSARALWARFVGEDPASLIYDLDFRGLKGPPPFNWSLAGNDVGVAERARGGGLDIEYFGRRSAPLAEQLLLLPPGPYRLEFRAEGDADAQGSRLVARISCRGRTATLGEILIRGLTYTPRTASLDFTVPSGCDAQELGFYGQAGEFPNSQRAKITGLSLRPVGGS